MKNQWQYLLNIVLLLVFFSTSATNAFSIPIPANSTEKAPVLKSKDFSHVFFAEETVVDLPAYPDNDGKKESQFLTTFFGYQNNYHCKLIAQAAPRCLDLKNFLKIQLYPFHSFW